MDQPLEATYADMPPAGNYIAGSHYLNGRPEAGIVNSSGDVRLVALPDDLLLSIFNVVEAAAGEAGSSVVLKSLGQNWGRRAAGLFGQESQKLYHRPVAQLPLAEALANLSAVLHQHGWGQVQVDTSRYAAGLLVVTIANPILGADVDVGQARVEHWTSGFLAGFFSQWAGVELDCIQTGGPTSRDARSTFVLSIPERLSSAVLMIEAGSSHAACVAHLETVRAA
jgi:predicted hydrocarbon binding protein